MSSRKRHLNNHRGNKHFREAKCLHNNSSELNSHILEFMVDKRPLFFKNKQGNSNWSSSNFCYNILSILLYHPTSSLIAVLVWISLRRVALCPFWVCHSCGCLCSLKSIFFSQVPIWLSSFFLGPSPISSALLKWTFPAESCSTPGLWNLAFQPSCADRNWRQHIQIFSRSSQELAFPWHSPQMVCWH